jgi:hypothetical protein
MRTPRNTMLLPLSLFNGEDHVPRAPTKHIDRYSMNPIGMAVIHTEYEQASGLKGHVPPRFSVQLRLTTAPSKLSD